MYSVFVQILLTGQGNKHLHEHQGDKYAQKVYINISVHALKSANAMLNSYKLLNYITSSFVVDGS